MQRTAVSAPVGDLAIYLVEEMGDARLRCSELKRYVDEAVQMVNKSENKDQLFEVAGHLIHGIPTALMKLEKALQAAAMSVAKLDYEQVKAEIRPEKSDELDKMLTDVRVRHVERRSQRTAMLKLANINHVASTLRDIAAYLETGRPSASQTKTRLRQVMMALASTPQEAIATFQPSAEATPDEVAEAFKGANPDLTEEDLDAIKVQYLKNKDVVTDKQAALMKDHDWKSVRKTPSEKWEKQEDNVGMSVEEDEVSGEWDWVAETMEGPHKLKKGTVGTKDAAQKAAEKAADAMRPKAKTAAYGDPHWIHAKYPGVAEDGTKFNKGDMILYWPRTKTVMVGKRAEDAWKRFESEVADEDFYNSGHYASEEPVARFEEGKPADPTENMSEEDAKRWKAENEAHKDEFKTAAAKPAVDLLVALMMGADKLYDARVPLRRLRDDIQDLYSDPTTSSGYQGYNNPDVREVRDSMQELDNMMGRVARGMENLSRVIDRATKTASGRSKEAATAATVGVFLDIMSHLLVQFDQRLDRRQPNPYRLGHYMKALQEMRSDLGKYQDRDDEEAMKALTKSMWYNFERDFPPAKALAKKIDAWVQSQKLPKMASDDSTTEKESRFEEGVSADPTENMSEADAKRWKAENAKHRDEFKTASEEPVAKFQEGKPADPTKNMSEEDAAKWKAENDAHKGEFKTAADMNVTQIKKAIKSGVRGSILKAIESMKEAEYSEAEMYRMALAADPEMDKDTWADYVKDAKGSKTAAVEEKELSHVKKRIQPHMWVLSKDGSGEFIVTIGDPTKPSSKIKARLKNKSELTYWVRDEVGDKVSQDHVIDLTGFDLVPEFYTQWYVDNML